MSHLRKGELNHIVGTTVNKIIDKIDEMDRLELISLIGEGNRTFIDRFIPTKSREWWRSIDNQTYKSHLRRRIWGKVVDYYSTRSKSSRSERRS